MFRIAPHSERAQSSHAYIDYASQLDAEDLLNFHIRDPFVFKDRHVWIEYSKKASVLSEQDVDPEERRRGFRQPTEPSHILWVSGFTESIGFGILKEIFGRFGRIKHIRIGKYFRIFANLVQRCAPLQLISTYLALTDLDLLHCKSSCQEFEF